jgi:MFS family permease
MIGIGISSFVSGFLAEQVGLRGTYFISIIPFVLALLILLSIREPQIHHDDEVESVIKKGYISHLLYAFKTVTRSAKLRLVAFGMIILFFIQTPMYEFNQYIYIELFKSPTLVGISGGLAGFMLALGFFIAIKRRFNARILLLLAGLAITMVGVLSNNYVLFFLAFILASSAILENALQTKLQHATTSRTRASVTSAVLFAGNVLVIPFVFLFGAVAERNSIWLAYLINGGIVLVLALVYFLLTAHRTDRLVS